MRQGSTACRSEESVARFVYIYNNIYIFNDFIYENNLPLSEYCFILDIKYIFSSHLKISILKYLVLKLSLCFKRFDLVLILKNITLNTIEISEKSLKYNEKKKIRFIFQI